MADSRRCAAFRQGSPLSAIAEFMDKKRPLSPQLLIKASMAAAVIAFFLPWVQLFPPASKKPKQSAKQKPEATFIFKGRMKSTASEFSQGVGSISLSLRKSLRMSGFEIPRAANSEAAKAAVQLAELFNKKQDFRTQLRQAGPRAYAVYLLPLVHIGLGLILLKCKQIHWLVGVAGFVAFLIPPIGFWQATKALAQSNGLATIEYGLRLSLLAYWGLTFAAAGILRQARGA